MGLGSARAISCRDRMQGAGYWVNGDQIIDVTFTSHIGHLCDHPSEFGFSEQEVKEAFERHGENLGDEGTAREELIRIATTRGSIRVRHYVSPRDYWSIQFDKIEERRETIVSFFRSMIEQGKMSKNDELRLIGFSDGFEKIYSFQEGGVGRFLGEQSGSPHSGKTAPDDNGIAPKRESDQSEDKGEKREGISSAPLQLPCPRCGSTNTEPVQVQMGFYWQCYTCGKVWDTNKE